MDIALLDIDSKIPNLALMKISAYHKGKGDIVSWYNPFEQYDILYMSKVFTFTEDYSYIINNAKQIIKGGTGYDIESSLPSEIDSLQPDYSIYPTWDKKVALGYLTRGCPNKCKWCVVPKKEGDIHPYMDIDEICSQGQKKAILMDNNILASSYGIDQLRKISKRGIRVDFNQGLDARLVTEEIAEILASIRWIKRIRFGCDTPKQVLECERAMRMIDSYGYKGEYFLYCIIQDFEESFTRINHFHDNKRVILHAQPYRDFQNKHQVIPQWQKDMAQWVDKKEYFRTTEFKDFSPRKGFKCQAYFNNL